MKKTVEIDIKSLSDTELTSLIKLAMTELQDRLSSPIYVLKQNQPEAVSVVIESPSKQEIALVNRCLEIVGGGGYVHANVKDEYKGIAKKYPDFFSKNGYPPDLRGSDFKNHLRYRD